MTNGLEEEGVGGGGGVVVGDGHTWKSKKGKAQMARAYPGFIRMKLLEVLLLPPGRDASPSHLEKSAKIKLSCEIYI